MKKMIGLCALFVLSSAAFADTKFSLGGGLNFNMINVEGDLGDFKEESSVSVAVAGKAEIGINEQWLFRTGLWLQEKTAELSYDKSGIEGSVKVHNIYASVPVNVQYKAHEAFSVFGGYLADVRINDYCSTSGDFTSCSLDEDSKSVVHNANLGVSVIVNEKLNIDVDWQQGLTDVYKDGLKRNTIQVMGFYKF